MKKLCSSEIYYIYLMYRASAQSILWVDNEKNVQLLEFNKDIYNIIKLQLDGTRNISDEIRFKMPHRV